jgi:hypothetical protein
MPLFFCEYFLHKQYTFKVRNLHELPNKRLNTCQLAAVPYGTGPVMLLLSLPPEEASMSSLLIFAGMI